MTKKIVEAIITLSSIFKKREKPVERLFFRRYLDGTQHICKSCGEKTFDRMKDDFEPFEVKRTFVCFNEKCKLYGHPGYVDYVTEEITWPKEDDLVKFCKNHPSIAVINMKWWGDGNEKEQDFIIAQEIKLWESRFGYS